jgi:hypothetical protein
MGRVINEDAEGRPDDLPVPVGPVVKRIDKIIRSAAEQDGLPETKAWLLELLESGERATSADEKKGDK